MKQLWTPTMLLNIIGTTVNMFFLLYSSTLGGDIMLNIMVNNMLDIMVNSINIIDICLVHWTYYTFSTQLFQAIISSKPKKVYFENNIMAHCLYELSSSNIHNLPRHHHKVNWCTWGHLCIC